MIFTRCNVKIALDEKRFALKLPIKPAKRTRRDMRSFVFNDDYLAKVRDPIYLMYRDVSSLDAQFRKMEKDYGIRYDLTLIRSGTMGPEYIRTAGHYHPKAYSEIYEVVHGKAAFLLQSKNLKKMVIAIADRGETVVIPAGFGHQTANIGNSPLVIGNLVCKDFKSDYSMYKKRRGGAFYLSQYKGPWIMMNANYGIPRAKFPKIKRIRGKKMGPIDKLFLKNPEKICRFLNGRIKSI